MPGSTSQAHFASRGAVCRIQIVVENTVCADCGDLDAHEREYRAVNLGLPPLHRDRRCADRRQGGAKRDEKQPARNRGAGRDCLAIKPAGMALQVPPDDIPAGRPIQRPGMSVPQLIKGADGEQCRRL